MSAETTPTTEPLAEIAAERRRQIEAEGWDAEHDDEHVDMSLARAAAAYAYAATLDPEALSEHGAALRCGGVEGFHSTIVSLWPHSWDSEWFKPKGSRRDLIVAGALIVAEIERIDREASDAEA